MENEQINQFPKMECNTFSHKLTQNGTNFNPKLSEIPVYIMPSDVHTRWTKKQKRKPKLSHPILITSHISLPVEPQIGDTIEMQWMNLCVTLIHNGCVTQHYHARPYTSWLQLISNTVKWIHFKILSTTWKINSFCFLCFFLKFKLLVFKNKWDISGSWMEYWMRSIDTLTFDLNCYSFNKEKALSQW